MKRILLLLSVLALAVVLLAACGGGSDNSGEKPAANNTNGGSNTSTGDVDPEKVFAANCASCHGASLEGGAGPKLSDIGSRLSKDQIRQVIANGQGFMGANIIDGAEADAVAAWLAEKK